MRLWRVFFLAPRSVSSVPLHHYRWTARLSPALKGMQTHIKRGPLVFEDFQALLFLLSSFLSLRQCERMLVGCLSWQHTNTHTLAYQHAVPHSAHLAITWEVRSPALIPPAGFAAQVSGGDTHAGQHNNCHKPKYGFLFYILSCLHHRCGFDMLFVRTAWVFIVN